MNKVEAESCGNKGEKSKHTRKSKIFFMTPTRAPPEKGIKIEVFLLMISSHRFFASNGLEKAEKTLWTELVVKFFIVCVHSGFISRRRWNGWVNVDGVLFQPIAPMSCYGVFPSIFRSENGAISTESAGATKCFLLLILRQLLKVAGGNKVQARHHTRASYVCKLIQARARHREERGK